MVSSLLQIGSATQRIGEAAGDIAILVLRGFNVNLIVIGLCGSWVAFPKMF